MNKRARKKWHKKSRVPKHLLRLVSKYSDVHKEYFIMGHDNDLIGIMTITMLGFATVIAVLEQIKDKMK